jgi:gamma-glutamyltranspeptidase/glutathione hydrolase
MLRPTAVTSLAVLLCYLLAFEAPSLMTATAAAGGLAGPTVGSWHGTGKNGAVATGGQEALDAGLEMLKSGGNAADAAVAATLVMNVTDAVVAFGGEMPILFYDAKTQSVEVLCGLGTAPRLATREYFAKKGGIPGGGPEPAAVPGTLHACCTLLDRHGTKKFGECAEAALRQLDKKAQPWHADLATTLRRLIEAEKVAGKDRKRGLRLVIDYFYRGPLAREIDAWHRANGGLIRYVDLATHVTRIEEPASVDYRGYTVYKCGFWNQGPYMLQTLQLLEGFDLKTMGHNKPDTVHVMVEALKLGLADRDVFYADPLFVDVPGAALLSPKYAEIRRPLIDMKKSSQVQQPGDPRKMKPLLDKADLPQGPGGPNQDTTTCVVVDKFGNAVAATPSGFSGVLMGKTGIWLSSRLQSFNSWEGHPNCIEPGKRPRITLTPGLVLKNGKVVLALSSAGGDQQDQALLQLLVNCLDFGMTPKQAVTAPRFGTMHHLTSFRQGPPQLGNVVAYPELGEALIKDLQARGAKVTLQKVAWGRPVVVHIDQATGVIEAAGDPMGRRNAGAY